MLLAVLVALPTIVLPSAHACFGPTPAVDAGVVYVVNGNSNDMWIAQANDVAVGIDVCSWRGPYTATYLESNGIEGLQTGGSCMPDTLVAYAKVGTTGQCRI